MAYCFYLLYLFIDKKWNFQKALVLFLASLVPFGTFWAVKHFKI
jgi:integral membrane protein